MISLTKPLVVVSVDGGLRQTEKGLTGGAAAIVFRMDPVAPNSKRIVIRTISVRGEFHDHDEDVTNNRMELESFILGLDTMLAELVDQEDGSIDIELWGDSQYAIGMLFRGWNAKTNHDLVDEGRSKVSRLQDYADVCARFIRGHQGFFVNEFADLVATVCVQRQADVNHELSFKDIEAFCLFCKNFPCEIREDRLGTKPIKKWKERFTAIRSDAYGPPCANRDPYNAEAKFRKPAARRVTSSGAGSGN